MLITHWDHLKFKVCGVRKKETDGRTGKEEWLGKIYLCLDNHTQVNRIPQYLHLDTALPSLTFECSLTNGVLLPKNSHGSSVWDTTQAGLSPLL